MLAAAGFEIVAADFEARLYGAYTCVKTSSGKGGDHLGSQIHARFAGMEDELSIPG